MDGTDLADDTFLAVPPALVASVVADPARWRGWWPDLRLRLVEDRADLGLRWSVDGAATGSAEIWLEPVLDGTVLHYYLRADLAEHERVRRGRLWKRHVHHLKDELEAGRRPGRPVGPPPPAS